MKITQRQIRKELGTSLSAVSEPQLKVIADANNLDYFLQRAREALTFAKEDDDPAQNIDLAILLLGLAKIKLSEPPKCLIFT